MEKFAMGWLPDVPKPNDYHLYHSAVQPELQKTSLASLLKTATAPSTPPTLPPKVDLRAHFSPVEDQGGIGSCTANSAVALVEYFQRRAAGEHIDASRLFVYKTTRNLLGFTGDTGAYLRTTMQSLVTFGSPPERYWPYVESRFDVEPTAFCYAFGQSFRPIKYFRLDYGATPPAQALANIKLFLSKGFPAMFGFPVYSEYMHPGNDGKIPFPGAFSSHQGGHANVAAGYDDNLDINGDVGALLVRNSWSSAWGDGGYGWLPYRFVTEGLAVDWWTMTKMDWVDTGRF